MTPRQYVGGLALRGQAEGGEGGGGVAWIMSSVYVWWGPISGARRSAMLQAGGTVRHIYKIALAYFYILSTF